MALKLSSRFATLAYYMFWFSMVGTVRAFPSAEELKLPDIAQIAKNISVESLGAELENSDTEIETWIPPEGWLKEFPYYLGGYDFEKRPYVVVELGRWKFRKYLEKDVETKKNMYKFGLQYIQRVGNLESPHQDAEDGVVLIFDFQGFQGSEIATTESVKFQLFCAREFDRFEKNFHDIVFINVNFIAQSYIQLIRSVAGRWVGKAEIHGSIKEHWLPVLVKKISKDQLPPWYGGSNVDYKPVRIYG